MRSSKNIELGHVSHSVAERTFFIQKMLQKFLCKPFPMTFLKAICLVNLNVKNYLYMSIPISYETNYSRVTK